MDLKYTPSQRFPYQEYGILSGHQHHSNKVDMDYRDRKYAHHYSLYDSVKRTHSQTYCNILYQHHEFERYLYEV